MSQAKARPHRILKVLILREGEHLVAQCLQYDMAAQASNMKELKKAFLCTFMAHVKLAAERGEKPLENLGRAPEWYWEKYEEAEKLLDRVQVKKEIKKMAPNTKEAFVPREAQLAIA